MLNPWGTMYFIIVSCPQSSALLPDVCISPLHHSVNLFLHPPEAFPDHCSPNLSVGNSPGPRHNLPYPIHYLHITRLDLGLSYLFI